MFSHWSETRVETRRNSRIKIIYNDGLTIAFTLTPKAGSFFSFAYSLLKIAFTKAELALGAGDARVVAGRSAPSTIAADSHPLADWAYKEKIV